MVEVVTTLVVNLPLRTVDLTRISDLEADVVQRLSAVPDLNAEAIRAVRREFSQRLASAPPELVIRLALRLIRRRVLSLRFVANELIHYHKPAFGSLNVRFLEKLGDGLDSWGAVDSFACYLAGPAWRERQISDAAIRSWARSKDRWWRRAALVSTVPLNCKARGGVGDRARTVDICTMLVKDRDDMVVKALSWALRELSKRDPETVRGFLAEHVNDLAPRVRREVNNKLVSGLKYPGRSGR
jgi:3-methyladenine DNA glycosylase AlkD